MIFIHTQTLNGIISRYSTGLISTHLVQTTSETIFYIHKCKYRIEV